MLEAVLKWEPQHIKAEYGYGKAQLFPGIPWASEATANLVPTIPDFVDAYDEEPKPKRNLLAEDLIEDSDESKKPATDRYGDFMGLFDNHLMQNEQLCDVENALNQLQSCMDSWKDKNAIADFTAKTKLPRKKLKEGSKVKFMCSSKNLLVAAVITDRSSRIYIWSSDTKRWLSTKITLQGRFGIAVSQSSKFIATYTESDVSCWRIANAGVTQLWTITLQSVESANTPINYLIAVSNETVVYEHPSSCIQTSDTLTGKKGTPFPCTVSATCISVSQERIVIGGLANMVQIFELHRKVWFTRRSFTVDSVKKPQETLRIPLKNFVGCRISGSKVALWADDFLVVYDNYRLCPMFRLYPARVFLDVVILGDYLLVLERAKPELFKLCVVEFVKGATVFEREIVPKRKEVVGDTSLLLATATEITVFLYDKTVHRFRLSCYPLEFKINPKLLSSTPDSSVTTEKSTS